MEKGRGEKVDGREGVATAGVGAVSYIGMFSLFLLPLFSLFFSHGLSKWNAHYTSHSGLIPDDFVLSAAHIRVYTCACMVSSIHTYSIYPAAIVLI